MHITLRIYTSAFIQFLRSQTGIFYPCRLLCQKGAGFQGIYGFRANCTIVISIFSPKSLLCRNEKRFNRFRQLKIMVTMDRFSRLNKITG